MTAQLTRPKALSIEDQTWLAEYLTTPPPPPSIADACCAAFARGVYAASIADPRCCVRCAAQRRQEALARRYAWRPAPFGRIRKVPASEAARWEDL